MAPTRNPRRVSAAATIRVAVDYDRVPMASSYDAARGYSPEALALWLDVIQAAAPREVSRILDLGCGTGRYSSALAARFGVPVVGVDRSRRMLSVAQQKPTCVPIVRGDAEALPLADGAFDLVFLSMVLHHFARPEEAARECRRVLRGGGVVCLRGGTTEGIGGYAYVPFFPTAVAIMERQLQPRARIDAIFRAEGLALAGHEIVSSPLAESWTAYASRLALRADSVLAQISDADFAEGMRRLEAYARTAPEGVLSEPVDFFVFRAA